MSRKPIRSIVFLGGGRITSALLAGLHLAEYDKPILVHDRNTSKLANLKRAYGVIVEPDIHRALVASDLLILAVRPGSVRELLSNIGEFSRPIVAVSLAAGIPLATLRKLTSESVEWARAMPSPVCRSGNGLTGLAFSRRFPSAAKRKVLDFFALTGTVLELPERKIDAFTVSYSPSHGYHALSALASAAEACGLDRRTALAAAAHALADSITSWRRGEQPLPELLDESATPGGIAAAVMHTMDQAGYRQMVKRSLFAGMRQAKKNARR